MEIRLHGRGGQGIVTAAEMLIEAVTLESYYGQSIPVFGAERRGAPVTSSARISDKPIRRHSQIYNPDIVAIFDPMFIYRQEVMAGLKESSSIIVNHKQRPDIQKFKLFVVDATGIAIENGLVVAGWAVVNTAMLGAIAKVLGVVSKDALEEVIKRKWGGDLCERNLRATLQAFKEVS